MTNRTLFPTDRAPHNSTAASKIAADLMQPFVGKQRERVWQFIKAQGSHGATDEEIQDGLKMRGDSERPRRNRLLEWGKIRDSGNLRKTNSGRPATVWIAVDDPPAEDSPNQTPENNRGGERP